MALSVCLLLDARADQAVRALWQRLEEHGIRTLLSHTHGRHRPHLTLASLLAFDLDDVAKVLGGLPAQEPRETRFDALGMFRRSRCWLVPTADAELVARQERVAAAVAATGAVLHRNYAPGGWTPHLTLAPRLHLDDLGTVARHTFEVLPLRAGLVRSALVDTSTGELHSLPHLV